jgi:cytochrome c oxidase assembly factor CtaG
MRRLHVDRVDGLGVLGLILSAAGVGVRWGFDLAAVLVGIVLMVLAVALAAAERSEGET